MDKSSLNKLYERAPVTSMQANLRQDKKAARLPDDKSLHIAKIDNQINKLIHLAKTKGNSPKIQRMLRRARITRLKLSKKLNS